MYARSLCTLHSRVGRPANGPEPGTGLARCFIASSFFVDCDLMLNLLSSTHRFTRVPTNTPGTALQSSRAQRRLNQCVLVALALTLVATGTLALLLAARKDSADRAKGPHFPGPYSERVDVRTAAVASENGICSDIGVDILKNGGSAVDAAIATSLCIGVTNSFSSGIGGGGFMLVRTPASNGSSAADFSFLDFRETAPASATTDMFVADPKQAQIGGLSVAVPGELRGFEEAHKRWGRLKWADIVEPAVAVAEDGWEVNAVMASRLTTMRDMILADTNGFAVDFAKDGEVLVEGDVVRRPRLAKTLRTIAQQGPSAFYDGPIADSMLKFIKSVNGIFTAEDLKNYTVRELKPLTTYYHGRKVVTAPVPSSGAMLLSILNIVEGFEFKARGNQSDTYHLLVEAFKFGAAQRGLLGDPIDPVFKNITQIEKMIIDKDLAANLRGRISSEHTNEPKFYLPTFEAREDHGTMHVSVLAADGSAVSLTSTINLIFGSQLMDPVTGVIFNDEMDDFSIPEHSNAFGLAPSPYNYIHPHKRPLSSMVPTIIDYDGECEIVIGASGGSMIPTSTVAAILNMIEFDVSINDAIDLPRFHHQLFPNSIKVENAFDSDLSAALERKGHVIDRLLPGQKFVGVSAIRRFKNGLITAASDARKGGLAAGY